jgi:hypothetical protein
MATLSDVKIKIKNSATPGTSDVKVSYKAHFDAYDRAVDQKYHAHLDLIGDDKITGEDQVNDTVWTWGMGDIKASMAPAPHTELSQSHIVHVATTALNEDIGSQPNPFDEISGQVSLTPVSVHTPTKVSQATPDSLLTL